jgi:hypothetical protein
MSFGFAALRPHMEVDSDAEEDTNSPTRIARLLTAHMKELTCIEARAGISLVLLAH